MNQRAIAYTRVSSQRQVDEGNSLSVQKKHILEYAEKNGFEIIGFDRYAYSNKGPEEHNMRIEMGLKLDQ